MGTLAAGIKEIFATAKTTGTNVMICADDGTPDGHITMSNLASVLGVNLNYSSSKPDLNDIKVNGFVICNYTGTDPSSTLWQEKHMPSYEWGVMFSFGNRSVCVQIYIQLVNSVMWVRNLYANSWYEWKKLSFEL